MLSQLLACRVAGVAIPAIDDRNAKAARRHGMAIGGQFLVEGDLEARDAGQGRDLALQVERRMAIARSMRRGLAETICKASRT